MLLRIADQVGYISKVNGKRTISFEPTDTFIGKNVAQLNMMEIPESSSADFSTFMANVISTVKQAIQNKSEEQKKQMRCFPL